MISFINVINGIINVINFVTPLRVSKISNRNGKSNNRYMGDRYDASKPTKYITYSNANNLYGWAMSKPLPTHGFNPFPNNPCFLRVCNSSLLKTL